MKLNWTRKAFSYISIVTLLCFITGCSSQDVKQVNIQQIEHAEITPEAEQDEVTPKEEQATEDEDTQGKQEDVHTTLGDIAEELEQTANQVVIGCDEMDENFNPFSNLKNGNESVLKQTQVYLLSRGRGGEPILNGKDGQTSWFEGTEYTYQGMSNILVEYDEKHNRTNYIISLRDDVRFSDGTLLTVDDLIFTLYMFCDPSYDGSISLKKSGIVGIENFVYDNSMADTISKSMIEKRIKNPTKELEQKVKEEAMLPLLKEELEYCRVMVGDDRYDSFTNGLTEAKDIFASIYQNDRKYDSTQVESEDQVISDIAGQYGYDFHKLASVYGDETYFDEQVKEWAKEELLAESIEKGAESVASIEGIKKQEDGTVKITTDGYDRSFLYELMIPICPMHYYGDVSLYDYENHQFGFMKGDLSLATTKSAAPLGAGPYTFVSYEDGSALLKANDDFYLGEPCLSEVEYQYEEEGTRIYELANGTIDLTNIIGSASRFEEIKNYNENKSLDGDKIMTLETLAGGYGYIGINARNVKIGSKQDTKESIYLRKALATVLAVNREASINGYYKDAATIVDTPAAKGVWYAPSFEGVSSCYSTDINGNTIYTEEMTQEEKYAAALLAAKDYLLAAGYEFDEKYQRFFVAPEEGSLTFNAFLYGMGEADHPAYAVLTATKMAFESIGITINIYDEEEAGIFWHAVDSGLADIWCAAWQTTSEPDLRTKYEEASDSTMLSIMKDMEDSKDYVTRKESCQKFYERLMDRIVEIPVYQRYNATIYRTEVFGDGELGNGYSAFWDWEDELYLISKKSN